MRLGEGDIFVFRTGHHRRRLELGPWNNGYDGEGKAGLHSDAMTLLHERKVAAFFPDGDGDTVPSNVEGVAYPVHALQIAAMGMICADSLNLEDVSALLLRVRRTALQVPGGRSAAEVSRGRDRSSIRWRFSESAREVQLSRSW